LRQSIAFDDEQSQDTGSDASAPANTPAVRDVDLGLPTFKSSTIKRTSSLKKKPASSRLSFGPGEIISGDAAEALEDDSLFTPQKLKPRRSVEPSGLRKSLPAYQIRTRDPEDDDDRPTYSKDYLAELKTSTPSTPKDLQSLDSTIDDDAMSLDASELAGATIVEPSPSTSTTLTTHQVPAHIPTAAEIAEKKERRARLAQEQDYISLDSGPSSTPDYTSVSLLPRRKKPESRLVRDDEDIAEGFDAFVSDGRIALGRKAEKAAKKAQRKEIAEMIHAAEGSSSEESDDSEAERNAEYEAAQTRKGMDGLAKPAISSTAAAIPPKVTPVPSLNECLARLKSTLGGMEMELAARNRRMAELQREKEEILAREQEVQRLLKEAGDKYAAIRVDKGLPEMDPSSFPRNGFPDALAGNRGLESFGNTPVGRPEMEDVG
jgi:hypothetical protein